MNPAWIWLGLAALALIGEVMTGTFYLLVVAAGCAIAAAAAWGGLDFAWQLAVCAVAVVAAMLILRRVGVLRKRPATAPSRNADVNLDIGGTVKVDAWNADGTARVWYRGAHWEAALAPGAVAAPGQYVITELRGNCLVLTPQF
ncbi:NfeD family protein [Pigmentiphaga soli]|uniref:NfeD family protein n=1 Tax=Pigmentiphaga soli TaxID=1007095 RepID=A0ABP8HE97_9BURK